VVVFAFDCWPADYDRWEAFFRRVRVRLAFLSARQSAQELARRLPETTVRWLPEATDPDAYRPDELLRQRPIDVLELGRRYEPYHRVVVEPFTSGGTLTHVLAVAGGARVPDEAETDRWARAEQGVDRFPASRTHPGSAGGVETATHRYFESIASKCLLVGQAPQELVDLFGYSPVVEVSWDAPSRQLRDILANVDHYQDFVDKNYARFARGRDMAVSRANDYCDAAGAWLRPNTGY